MYKRGIDTNNTPQFDDGTGAIVKRFQLHKFSSSYCILYLIHISSETSLFSTKSFDVENLAKTSSVCIGCPSVPTV